MNRITTIALTTSPTVVYPRSREISTETFKQFPHSTRRGYFLALNKIDGTTSAEKGDAGAGEKSKGKDHGPRIGFVHARCSGGGGGGGGVRARLLNFSRIEGLPP